VAVTAAGKNPAASRLIGYQMLRSLSSPYNIAKTPMAAAPARPPLTPAATGYVSSGSHARGEPPAISTRATVGRDVTTAGSSGRTGTASCASCGRTLRNQPTAPAITRTAPRTLTDALVTSPAKSSVVPNASTIGHAVGAGSSMVFGVGDSLAIRMSLLTAR